MVADAQSRQLISDILKLASPGGSIPMLQKAKILNCKLTIQVGTTKLQHLRNTFRFPLRA
jgi:hypothetical protein